MTKAKLIWSTPNGENLIAQLARVSNVRAKETDPPEKLIAYLIKHKHWSPFEMCHACLQIDTTRDIARQILRHRSFSFQEFSQRYADPSELTYAPNRTARLQDKTNRQNSFATDDPKILDFWDEIQNKIRMTVDQAYSQAIDLGIAKEVARVILPEGLTASRLFMSGSIRSWLHYIDLRSKIETQLEHRAIVDECYHVLNELYPLVFQAFGKTHDR